MKMFPAATMAAAILAAAACQPALAQPDGETLFDRLEGVWLAEGKAFGADAKTRMEWTETLGGRFHRVSYRIEMSGPQGPSAFEGVGHYQATSPAAARGYWADNSGDLHPLRAQLSDDAIATVWGVAGEKQGRTEYRLNPDGTARVTDWILGPDGWRQFNQATFRRAQ